MRLHWWLPFGQVPESPARELAEALQRSAPPLFLDVRTAGEFAAGHVEGAVNLPITELAHRLPELELDPGRPVVAICLTAHRSIPAVRLLRGHGLQARQLAGGMRAWRAAGLPERRS